MDSCAEVSVPGSKEVRSPLSHEDFLLWVEITHPPGPVENPKPQILPTVPRMIDIFAHPINCLFSVHLFIHIYRIERTNEWTRQCRDNRWGLPVIYLWSPPSHSTPPIISHPDGSERSGGGGPGASWRIGLYVVISCLIDDRMVFDHTLSIQEPIS